MSLKKRYLKSRPVCKVTFRLDGRVAANAETVFLAGDFNDWDIQKTPMKKLKNGAFTVTLDLPVNRQYQFRYLVDQETWKNDRAADHYVPSGFADSKNCVVVV